MIECADPMAYAVIGFCIGAVFSAVVAAGIVFIMDALGS